MTRLGTPPTLAGLAALTLTLAVVFELLIAISHPAGSDAHLREAQVRATDIRSVLHQPPLEADQTSQDVCPSAASFDAAAFATQLRALATRRGVALNRALIGSGAGDNPGKLTPVRVDIEAKGRADFVTSFVSDLQTVRPAIFIDHADLYHESLNLQPNSATFYITGRVYCWTMIHR